MICINLLPTRCGFEFPLNQNKSREVKLVFTGLESRMGYVCRHGPTRNVPSVDQFDFLALASSFQTGVLSIYCFMSLSFYVVV